MGRLRAALLTALVLAGIGGAYAEGSFSARLDVLALDLEVNLEQEVTRSGAWVFYAGSGFAVNTSGVTKLQPYTMACRNWDLTLAYTEVCTELRAPIIGPGSILRVFVSTVW